MHQLIFRGAKYSFFLLFILSLPILIETEQILRLWLKTVPEYTVIFTRLVIINVLIDCISGPLMTAAQASGKIKLYQSVVGGLLILNLPVSYLFLKLGFQPQVTMYISIGISIIALYSRLKIISPLVSLSIMDYLKNVIVKIIPVIFIAVILPGFIIYLLPVNIERLLLTCFIAVISAGLTVYFIGLSHSEQQFMIKSLKRITSKIKL